MGRSIIVISKLKIVDTVGSSCSNVIAGNALPKS